VELTGEARLHDKIGVAVIGGGGKATDRNGSGITATVYEVGGPVRAYVIGDFRHGMQVGGEVLYLHLADSRISATGEGLAIGPFVGYKLTIDAGFTFDAQLGVEHLSLQAHNATDSASNKTFIPLLNLNVGWSF
jgi:hypothetical protein